MPRKRTHKNILILGATSDMALAFIHLIIDKWQRCTFHLLARNTATLEDFKTKAEALGHQVFLHTYDLLNPPELHFSGIEYYIAYAGWLPPNNNEPEKTMLVNNTAIQHFTDKVITANRNHLDHIIITGSIAGVRVRQSNWAYGQAKAGLHAYVKALQKKIYPTITCTLVIPGYVKTKMIAHQKTPGFLTTTPGDLALKYWTLLETKPLIAWSQPVWRLIAVILKLLPKFIINRLK